MKSVYLHLTKRDPIRVWQFFPSSTTTSVSCRPSANGFRQERNEHDVSVCVEPLIAGASVFMASDRLQPFPQLEMRGLMEANTYSKYALNDLRQSIALIDRKIAHSTNVEIFDFVTTREAALRKLSSKRAALVKTVLALTEPAANYDPVLISQSSIHLVESEPAPRPAAQTAKSDVPETRRRRR